MTTDTFWDIIESARAEDSEPDSVAASVQSKLEELPLSEVLGFNEELDRRRAESYRWDLWAVAYIVNGGCSDDGFEYFRAWLIAKGRSYFEAALADPVRAADEAEFDANECEDMLYVASSVYRDRTGDYPKGSGVAFPTSPIGDPWDEDDVDSLFPELKDRF